MPASLASWLALIASLPVSLSTTGGRTPVRHEGIRGRFHPALFRIEESQIVLHEADERDLVGDLLDAYVPSDEYDTQAPHGAAPNWPRTPSASGGGRSPKGVMSHSNGSRASRFSMGSKGVRVGRYITADVKGIAGWGAPVLHRGLPGETFRRAATSAAVALSLSTCSVIRLSTTSVKVLGALACMRVCAMCSSSIGSRCGSRPVCQRPLLALGIEPRGAQPGNSATAPSVTAYRDTKYNRIARKRTFPEPNVSRYQQGYRDKFTDNELAFACWLRHRQYRFSLLQKDQFGFEWTTYHFT